MPNKNLSDKFINEETLEIFKKIKPVWDAESIIEKWKNLSYEQALMIFLVKHHEKNPVIVDFMPKESIFSHDGSKWTGDFYKLHTVCDFWVEGSLQTLSKEAQLDVFKVFVNLNLVAKQKNDAGLWLSKEQFLEWSNEGGLKKLVIDVHQNKRAIEVRSSIEAQSTFETFAKLFKKSKTLHTISEKNNTPLMESLLNTKLSIQEQSFFFKEMDDIDNFVQLFIKRFQNNIKKCIQLVKEDKYLAYSPTVSNGKSFENNINRVNQDLMAILRVAESNKKTNLIPVLDENITNLEEMLKKITVNYPYLGKNKYLSITTFKNNLIKFAEKHKLESSLSFMQKAGSGELMINEVDIYKVSIPIQDWINYQLKTHGTFASEKEVVLSLQECFLKPLASEERETMFKSLQFNTYKGNLLVSIENAENIEKDKFYKIAKDLMQFVLTSKAKVIKTKDELTSIEEHHLMESSVELKEKMMRPRKF